MFTNLLCCYLFLLLDKLPFSLWHFTRTEKWEWGIEGLLAIFQVVLIMRLYTSSEMLLIASSIVLELHGLLFPGAAVTYASKSCCFNAKSWQSPFKWQSTWNEFGLIIDVSSRTLKKKNQGFWRKLMESTISRHNVKKKCHQILTRIHKFWWKQSWSPIKISRKFQRFCSSF